MGCCNTTGSDASGQLLVPQKSAHSDGFTLAQLIQHNMGNISTFYDMDREKLREGSFGSVHKAKNKSTGQARAIKTVGKAQMKNVERFKQEIAIMTMMDHPNIIKLHETFEDHRKMYLVMELCSGGELFDRIIDAGHFTEVQAASVMQQIVSASCYMHASHVTHRDLKPENLLLMTRETIETNHLKIIDFGVSCSFEPGQLLTTATGTPYYVSPQVLAGKYDHMSDLWSIGVIMYVMLCGYPPFFGETDAQVLAKVRAGSFSFPADDWKDVSEDAKNLIYNLLKMDPRDRYTAEQTLNHEWIKNKAPKAKQGEFANTFVDRLRGFRSYNKLKKAALAIIARQLNENQTKQLSDTFMSLDTNSDGFLSMLELKQGLETVGIKDIPSDFQEILKGMDLDGSGAIDYTEFLAAALDKRNHLKEDMCWAAFCVFDKDGNGTISQSELKAVLASGQVDKVAGSMQELIAEVDQNGDGEIDFEEFMAMMKGVGEKKA